MRVGDGTSRSGRLLLALAVVHPAPSVINAGLVAALASIAGGSLATAALLAAAMLGFQFSIGALNDIADAEADRVGKPRKPIPSGRVAIASALAIVVLGAAGGLVVSATFGFEVLVLGLLGYACGVAYDVAMRRWGLGWLCYAAAFPLLLTWTWVAAAASLPPGWPFLLPVAALAGPALHLANSLVDAGSDERTGRPSLAVQLGPRRARRTLAVLMAAILVLAWATLGPISTAPTLAVAAGLVASAAIFLGVALSWRTEARSLEAGWLSQAVGLAIMSAAWLASISAT